MRLDRWLFEQQLAPSRSKAEDWIESGLIEIYLGESWNKIRKCAFDIAPEFSVDHVRVISNDLTELVSRAGAKLAGFVDDHPFFDFKQTICLDVGQSTGGFTEVLLQRGAALVVGVEVGHSQLHSRFKNDTRVISFENLHIADWPRNEAFRQQIPATGFDWIVVDVSFISLTLVLPHLRFLGRKIIFLIKPQFEGEKKNAVNSGCDH